LSERISVWYCCDCWGWVCWGWVWYCWGWDCVGGDWDDEGLRAVVGADFLSRCCVRDWSVDWACLPCLRISNCQHHRWIRGHHIRLKLDNICLSCIFALSNFSKTWLYWLAVSLNPTWRIGPEDAGLEDDLRGTRSDGDTSGGVVAGLELEVLLAWFEIMKGCICDVMAISSGRTTVGEFKLSIVVVGTSGGIRYI